MKQLHFGFAIALALAPSLAYSQTPHDFRFIGIIDNGGQVGFVDASERTEVAPIATYSQLWVYTPPIAIENATVAYVIRHDEDDCESNTRRQVYSALYDANNNILKSSTFAPPFSKIVSGGNAELSHKIVCSKEAGVAGPIGTIKAAIEKANAIAAASRKETKQSPH